MSRIRSIKPSFFRHEKLQEMGPLSMLIFSGLWTQCDKAGRFPWRPRTLKLDILPFIDFDMAKELIGLAEAGFVIKYESQGEFFGVIPTFLDHQRITGKEGMEPAKYPDPATPKAKPTRKLRGDKSSSDGDTTGTQRGHTGDGLVSQEGKGNKEREMEMEGKGESAASPALDPLFQNPDFQSAWTGWLQWRNTAKPKLTDHAKDLNFAELKKLAGDDTTLAVKIVNRTVERSWKGFFPLKEEFNGNRTGANLGRSASHDAKNSREFPEKLSL